jgi:hypothetical protein
LIIALKIEKQVFNFLSPGRCLQDWSAHGGDFLVSFLLQIIKGFI